MANFSNKFIQERDLLLNHLESLKGDGFIASPELTDYWGKEQSEILNDIVNAMAYLHGTLEERTNETYPELVKYLNRSFFSSYHLPFPSSTVCQFMLDENISSEEPSGSVIDRGTEIQIGPFQSTSGEQKRWKFRTSSKVHLLPIHVIGFSYQEIGSSSPGIGLSDKAALRIDIESFQSMLPLGQMDLSEIEFYIDGENKAVRQLMTSLFSGNQTGIVISDDDLSIRYSDENCIQCGLDSEGVVVQETSDRKVSEKFLRENIYIPEKQSFFRLHLNSDDQSALRSKASIFIYFDRFEDHLKTVMSSLQCRLGCTVAINLFDSISEPIPISDALLGSEICLDSSHSTNAEIHKIVNMVLHDKDEQHVLPAAFTVGSGRATSGSAFAWQVTEEHNNEIRSHRLNLIALRIDQKISKEAYITAQAIALNRTHEKWDSTPFQNLKIVIVNEVPLNSRCLSPPKRVVEPTYDENQELRLLSNLNQEFGYKPIDLETFKQIIIDICGLQSASEIHWLNLITEFRQVPTSTQLPNDPHCSVVTGVRTEIAANNTGQYQFGLYPIAQMIDRFLGYSAPASSFHQLSFKIVDPDDLSSKIWEFTARNGRESL
jgi:type VI protein secretion system component VasA